MSTPGVVFSAWSKSDGGGVSSEAVVSGGFEESWYSGKEGAQIPKKDLLSSSNAMRIRLDRSSMTGYSNPRRRDS